MEHIQNHRVSLFASALILILTGALLSCHRAYVPRPYGYYRITLPDTAYSVFRNDTLPYSFDVSDNAIILPHLSQGEKGWIDIHYPTLNADIHCSYKPVQNNLRELTDDAVEFVYKHTMVASAIPEKEYAAPEQSVYGVCFSLRGNTASPYQFFMTDSVHHFFRGAAYCNCQPNADSLAPVLDYLERDIIHLIETFEWQ